MEKPAQPVRRAAPGGEAPEHCRYCGARLFPGFYFCVTCATPYKDVESVLPPVRLERPTDGQLIAMKAPHVWPLFWTYVAVVVGTAVVCFVLFRTDRPDLTLLVQMAALFVTTCIFAALHWPSLAVQLKRLGLFRPAALLGLLALAPLLGFNYLYHGWLIRQMGAEHTLPLSRLRELGLTEPTLIFFFCVCPAVIEEIAFRGLVQHWLQVAISPVRALVLASALFTVLHFSVLSAPYIFAVGMVLGVAKWKTGSLYPSMLIHLIHNLVVLEFFWG